MADEAVPASVDAAELGTRKLPPPDHAEPSSALISLSVPELVCHLPELLSRSLTSQAPGNRKKGKEAKEELSSYTVLFA